MDDIHDVPDGLPRLRAVMARLRDPETGCPWDVEQDFDSIAPYTIEEAYEVADAIARRAWGELEGELGDLLLQVVYHARMAEEAGLFDFDAVARGSAAKMIRRHPHVFGDEANGKTSEQQVRDWEAQKAAERAHAGALDGVALALPALTRALKLQRRAARIGFDWPDVAGPLAKVAEEARELLEADAADREAEAGDLLFSVVNVLRHLGLEPETALRGANARFTERFESMERKLSAAGRKLEECGPEELDRLWRQAKREQARQPAP
jgi:ATP diphosphatase